MVDTLSPVIALQYNGEKIHVSTPNVRVASAFTTEHADHDWHAPTTESEIRERVGAEPSFLMPYLSGVTSGSARRLGSALMDAGVDQSTAWRVAGAASALIGLALVGQIVKNRRARQMGPSFDV